MFYIILLSINALRHNITILINAMYSNVLHIYKIEKSPRDSHIFIKNNFYIAHYIEIKIYSKLYILCDSSIYYI